MKKVIIFILLILVIGVFTWYFIRNNNKTVEYVLNNNTIEVLSSVFVNDLVESSDREILNGNEEIKTDTVGKHSIVVKFDNKEEVKVDYTVVDTTKPTVEGPSTITIYVGDKIDFDKLYTFKDNYDDKVTYVINGDYDTNKAGIYTVTMVYKDSSGNEDSLEIKIEVKQKEVVVTPKPIQTNNGPKYYIKINRKLNVVMIYGQDSDGNYTKLVKTFVCSAGLNNATPLGKYKTSDKHRWGSLIHGLYAQYSTRIVDGILFHTVPYTKNGDPSSLKDGEYNKLGENASAGCIRLSVGDCKWIYDNIEKGTTVEIYDSDTLPNGVVKPTAIKIDDNNPNKGWDPTDPDPNNPWNK